MEKRRHCPTMLQLRYLEEAKKAQDREEKCSVVKIAQKAQVTHGTISRFFRECREQGYMTEEYRLTEKGIGWLETCKAIRDDVRGYLEGLKIKKEELEAATKAMVENVDISTLHSIVEREKLREKYERILHFQNGSTEVSPRDINELMAMGKFPVQFVFRRSDMDNKKRSMADYGFEKPGLLVHTRRGVWLELTIRELRAPSGEDGHMMVGSLATMKYELDGQLRMTPIRDGRVRIPMEAFRFICLQKGQFVGVGNTTVTCSVGEKHMPESTARLIFWL